MTPLSFNINYQDQILQVEKSKDVNDEIFYKISLPGQEKIDIYVTPSSDGLTRNWAEGKGVKTNRAREIGELIETYEQLLPG